MIAAGILIAWIQLSETAVREKCHEITGKYAAVGCAVISGDACTIYSPPIRHGKDDHRFKILGEEVAHCFLGDFHKADSPLRSVDR